MHTIDTNAIRGKLFKQLPPGQPYQSAESEQAHLFEQYKLYVEMADRVSARRSLANTFFLTAHTAVVTTFAALMKDGVLTHGLVGTAPFLTAILFCYAWARIVSSYRQLNSGKFKVIHELEKKLPVAPYAAEWQALAKGQDSKVYRPLTHVENLVPACFALLYGFLAAALWCRP